MVMVAVWVGFNGSTQQNLVTEVHSKAIFAIIAHTTGCYFMNNALVLRVIIAILTNNIWVFPGYPKMDGL